MIDHMMLLGQQLKQQLNQDIFNFEQEINMPFVTSMEEAGIEKGIEKGEHNAELRIATKMIEAGKSDQEIVKLTDLSLKAIKELRQDLDS